MNWLRKFWDEYNWVLFLPLILVIGILVSIIIIGIRFGVIYIFKNVPFFAWGSFFGSAFLFGFGWYLKEKINKNKEFNWSLAAQISPISIAVSAIGLTLLSTSIVWILLPASVKSFWEIVQHIGFFLIVSLIFYAFVYVCGQFLAQGIILMRRGIFSGFFLILISLIGVAPIFLKLYDLFEQNYSRKNWLTAVFFTAISLLIIIFLTIYAIIPAFRIDKFSLEQNKKDELI